jgi:hypothetical protein
MKLTDLFELTDITVIEGGQFGWDDFGRAWYFSWDGFLSAVVRLDDQEVCFVECMDSQTEEFTTWMAPQFAGFDLAKEHDVEGITNTMVDNIERVFDVWHKNKENVEEVVRGDVQEFSDGTLDWN